MKKAMSIHFSKSGTRHGMLLLLALLLMSMLPKSAAAQLDLDRLMTIDDGITVVDKSTGSYQWTESDKEEFTPGVTATIQAASSSSMASATLTLRITSQKDFQFGLDYMFPYNPDSYWMTFTVDGVECKTALYESVSNFILPISAGTHDVSVSFFSRSVSEATAYIYKLRAFTTIDKPQEKRPVAVYSKRDKTFTFYYDTEVRPFSGDNITFDVATEGDPTWFSVDYIKEGTKTVVFDPSFKDYRPETVAYWFYDFKSLTQLRGMENLNTSETENFIGMFEGCKSLRRIGLSHLDTSKGKNFGDMFSYCPSLETLDLSGFNTEACVGMMSMFSNCAALKELDLSAFNTANVSTMMYMFENCENLQTIYATDAFTTSQVGASDRMFSGCYNLKGAKDYNSSCTDAAYANYTTGYFTKGCLHTDAAGGSTLGSPIVREATCIEGAHTEYTCSLCQRAKKVYSGAANPDAHSIKKHEAAEPTCVQKGNKEYYACELCERVWLDAALTKEAADESEYMTNRTNHVLDANGDCTGCRQHVMTLNGVTAQFYNIADTSWEILNNEEEGRQGLVNHYDNDNPLAIILTSDKDFELTMGFSTSAGLTYVADGKTYDMYNAPGAFTFKAGTRKFVIMGYGNPGQSYTELYDIKASVTKPMDPAESCGKIAYDKNTCVATLYSNDKAPAESGNLTVTSLPSFEEMPSSIWFDDCRAVEKVVIDESLKGVKPKSTVAWFAGMNSCREIVGLENLDLSETTTTAYMFYYGCYLNTLDLTTFNTAKVKDMSGMFANCYGLKTIYAGEGFSTASVEKSDDMFKECDRLKGAVNFDSGKTNHECANYETGYFTKGCLHKDAAGNSTLVKTEDVAADCQTAAHAIYECSICHKTVEAGFTGEPDLTKHKIYQVSGGTESSCTMSGSIALYRCETCNKNFDSEDATHELTGNFNVEIPALGHDFDDSYTCCRCGITDLRYKALSLTGLKAIIFGNDIPWKLADENDAAKGLMCGNKGEQASYSEMRIRLISDKPFRMDFGYKVSSEPGYDELRISVDGTNLYSLSGEKEGGKTQYFFAGTHDITFGYYKNVINDQGDDTAWLTSFSATSELTADDMAKSVKAAVVYNYDDKSITWKAVDINTEVSSSEVVYEIDLDDTSNYSERPWNENAYEAASARIDESFSQFRPKSVSSWFVALGVSHIDGLQYLNTSETEDFSYAFAYSYVNTLDLSTFDTSNGRYFYDMFGACSSLQELDLAAFDMSNAENTFEMFAGCVSLDKIFVNKHFDISAVSNRYSEDMFFGCLFLSGGKEYDPSYAGAAMANYRDGYLSTYYKVGDKRFTLNGDMTVDSLTLEDGKLFMTHDAFTAKKATLKRTLADDNTQNLGTICLPYAVKATAGYTLYAVKSVGGADEPASAKGAASGTEYSTLYLEKISDELPAGTPAIFKAQAKTVDFAAAGAAVVEQPADDEALARDGYMLRGYFTEYDVEPESYVYAGGEFVRASALSADGTAVTGAPLTACLAALPGFGLTADRLWMESDDKQVSAVQLVESLQKGKAEIYDMNGVRLNELQPGVNIIRHASGKTQKVVMR